MTFGDTIFAQQPGSVCILITAQRTIRLTRRAPGFGGCPGWWDWVVMQSTFLGGQTLPVESTTMVLPLGLTIFGVAVVPPYRVAKIIAAENAEAGDSSAPSKSF